MKQCPTCSKEFPDSMRFCQTDGTLLVEKVDAAPVDPYKTVVGNQDDITAAIPPLDPFKTMVAGQPPKKVEDDLLQLPEEPDSLKTMVASQDDLTAKPESREESSPLDLPPAPYAPSAPLIEPKAPGNGAPPKLDNPFAAPPKFDDVSAAKQEDDYSNAATAIVDKADVPPMPLSPFESKPFDNDFSGQSPYGNQDNKPIPSPFDLSMPPGYMPPSMNPFEEPKSNAPLSEAPEPKPAASPFDASSPFGNADPFSQNQPLQQAEWTPPPAPDANWQNKEIGANSPLQPPVVGGQNQTLAIASLVCGVLGIICCGLFTGIPAIITGFMAKNKADASPGEFGGRGLAIAGIALGGVSILFSLLGILYYIIVLGSVASRGY